MGGGESVRAVCALWAWMCAYLDKKTNLEKNLFRWKGFVFCHVYYMFTFAPLSRFGCLKFGWYISGNGERFRTSYWVSWLALTRETSWTRKSGDSLLAVAQQLWQVELAPDTRRRRKNKGSEVSHLPYPWTSPVFYSICLSFLFLCPCNTAIS